jgi:hypothetical protein
MRVGTHHPQPMKIDFLPPQLSKIRQITPVGVLKNHNKSQKNHKMKNQTVLDFKFVVLRSEHTIWNA